MARRRGPEVTRPNRRTPVSGDLSEILKAALPHDHARQVTSRYYIEREMTFEPKPRVVIDLGCGRGDSVDVFRKHAPDVSWIGIDIGDSQEAKQRTRRDAPFLYYDGWDVPLADSSVDVVYSHQVLEHVRDPAFHLAEVARVLRPGGAFIGSTSQFEPYHSRSYWNFTPLGFQALVEDAGLTLEELRPGIDGITLILRTFLGRPARFSPWFAHGSPLHTVIDEWAQRAKRRTWLVNLRKVQFAGQFAFCARRPASRGVATS
jgi:SAM-dependent methyltransferase